MGVLTDFFVASAEELRAACRGWKEPLPTPVKRQTLHPFTKRPMEIMTTGPDPGEPFDPDTVRSPDLSPFRPVDFKGLGTTEMEDLMRAALDATDEQVNAVYDTALYGPPETEQLIFRVPPPLVERLAGMSPRDLEACGKRWNALVGDEPGPYLAPLAELARKAKSENRQLYMWICP